MSELVVVAGATGYLGRYLVQTLSCRGYSVRAIVRSRARAEEPGAFDAPSLAGSVNEWAEGDITDPAFVEGVCRGAQRVVSALGVTRQKASPWDVDYLANLHLLEDAEREDLRSFLYVGVMHVAVGRSLTMRSKAAFTQLLSRSSMTHQVINPSGYFSDLTDMLKMARTGIAILPPDPGTRISPIHGEDLARFCADHLGEATGTWDVGGPDVLTYSQVAHLASQALGKRCRTVTIPQSLLQASVWIASRLGDRPGNLAQFLAEGLTHDAIGERFGDHHISTYFQELAATLGPN